MIIRVTTPSDDAVAGLLAWLDGAWFVWVSLILAIGAIIAVVAVLKVRARRRERIPQYRRGASERVRPSR